MTMLKILLVLGSLFLTVVFGTLLFIHIRWWSVIPTSILVCGTVAILLVALRRSES